MTNYLIYGGLGIMLCGAIFGFVIAAKGYKETNWSDIKRISSRSNFHRGKPNPGIKRLSLIWIGIMLLGLIVLGIGISTGLN